MSRAFSIRLALLTGASALCLASATAQEAETVQPEPEGEQLVQQTIIVRGEFIPDEKRTTSEISSVLDAGDFELQGDPDVASALARAVGVSIADGRFVYVRGLNERYSSATLNRSPIPSPEPLRRVAPLDLFPTSAIESTLVQKTFSPEYSGEFGGGVIDIRTKAIPTERFLEIGVSGGIDSETTFEDGLLYDGDDQDWTGFDGGTRNLPDSLAAVYRQVLPAPGTPENLAIGLDLLRNSSLTVLQSGDVAPDFGVSVSAGDRIDISNDLTMGVLGSLSYSNGWETQVGTRGTTTVESVDGKEVVVPVRLGERRSTTNEIGFNGLGVIGFDILSNHELQFVGFFSRSTDKDAQTTSGLDLQDSPNPDEAERYREDQIEWRERQLWTTQVQGSHVFPDFYSLQVDWRGSYSEAFRDAPYNLTTAYADADRDGIFTPTGGTSRGFGGQRNSLEFSKIEDDSTDFGIDVVLPLDLVFGLPRELDLKAGYAYVESDREVASRLFLINTPVNTAGQRIDYHWIDAFALGLPGTGIRDIGSDAFPQAYIATLEVDAGYLGFDWQVNDFLRIALGGRYEDSIEAADTFQLTEAEDPKVIEGVINDDAFLPAATLTWNFADDLQLRLAYSETITRPQFREFASSIFTDPSTDVIYRGNPFLVNSSLTNYDARLEYYFARDQFITIGAFFKEIEKPIEEVLFPNDAIITTQFVNAPSAEVYGFEFEYEQVIPLDRWFDVGFVQGKDWLLKTNYTYTASEVSADGEVITPGADPSNPERTVNPAAQLFADGRPLQGQSDHLLNFQFGYSDYSKGVEVNLLVNYASERIRSAEFFTQARKFPAIIEQVPITVDFVYNRDLTLFGQDYRLSVNLNNIFGDDYEAYREFGGERIVIDSFEVGQSVSVGLKRRF